MIRKKAKKKTVVEKRNYAKKSLSSDVEKAMKRYLNDLNGHTPNKLHDIFLEEVEKPFLDVVMQYTDWNVTHASTMLGMNRATLRNRLKKYKLD